MYVYFPEALLAAVQVVDQVLLVSNIELMTSLSITDWAVTSEEIIVELAAI